MNALELLKKMMNSDRFSFCEDENNADEWYYPLYRERGDEPFSPKCVQDCWDAARNGESMKDVFEDVLGRAFDDAGEMNALKCEFQREIGKAILAGNPVEIPQNFDFAEWYRGHVYNRAFPSEYAHDGYSVCADTGETLATFLAKHPEIDKIDMKNALERVYADTERDADETIFYTGNMELFDLWELSDMENGGGAVEFKNVRLGNDDLPLTVSVKIPVEEIKTLTVEQYDRTGNDATIYRN